MYLFGYHTHSRLPFNVHAPLPKLAETAADAGPGELYVTDHFDFLDENGVPAEGYDWAPAAAQHQQTLPTAEKHLTLKLGLELDMPHLNPAAAVAICTRLEANSILDSVHDLSPGRGGADLFFLNFFTVQARYDAPGSYFASLTPLATTDFYDVLAHLIYPLRYIRAPVTLNRYQNTTWVILRTTVEKDRGTKVDTCRGCILEGWWPILALYQGYDGEIVTVGSDAYTPAGVGKGVRTAYALLRGCGFRRVCTYERHQPVFHTLG